MQISQQPPHAKIECGPSREDFRGTERHRMRFNNAKERDKAPMSAE
jgi:hypothetical protein